MYTLPIRKNPIQKVLTRENQTGMKLDVLWNYSVAKKTQVKDNNLIRYSTLPDIVSIVIKKSYNNLHHSLKYHH